MADPEVRIGADAPDGGDIDMQGGDNVVEVGETGTADAPGEDVAEETAMETDKPVACTQFVE